MNESTDKHGQDYYQSKAANESYTKIKFFHFLKVISFNSWKGFSSPKVASRVLPEVHNNKC